MRFYFFISTGTAHCANMYPSSSNDTPQLSETREEVGKILEEWLRESDTIKKTSTSQIDF